MEYGDKLVFKLKDGRNEPIEGLADALRIILIDEEQAGAQDITFGYTRFNPKSSVHKKHRHEKAEEIMYILSGRGIGGVNDEEVGLVKDDTLWVPRGALHWFYNPFDEPCESLFLYTRSSLKRAAYETFD